MLEEHETTAARLEHLRRAAEAEGKAEYARLAEEIGVHARTEELVLHPSALMIGEAVRLRRGGDQGQDGSSDLCTPPLPLPSQPAAVRRTALAAAAMAAMSWQ